MTTTLRIEAIDPEQLRSLRTSGVDHGGNPVEPFVDHDGGWPLRCCLADSVPGDEIAIVAWSPFPWRGAYAETGPIVVHAHECGGYRGAGVPAQFLTRRQHLRPYGHDHRIAYEHTAVVEGDGSLPDRLADLVARGDVDFVHVRNTSAGCYSFTARRVSD
jgi:hypothetical protein